MYNVVKVNEDVTYIGASDRRIELFENIYPLTNGVSYNSYLVKDEKTVLLDTVDGSVRDVFLENLAYALSGRKLDYIIVNHMEPDHCKVLSDVLEKYPEAVVVSNIQVKNMIGQFFNCDISERFEAVAEGKTLETGKHTFQFVMAPMVHWPEVMVTYDTYDKILYSADAFGTFNALSGNIFADETDFMVNGVAEARRYYTNIVGKFGAQVQALLKKAAGLDIQMICPLHGPIIRENLGWYLDKYTKWSTYTPEDNTVLIAYSSVYGNTENAASILATELAKRNVKNIVMYDVSKTHFSYLIAEAFRCSHIVLASQTYNNGLFPSMETFLTELVGKGLQNRTVAFMENGTWGPMSAKFMNEYIEKLKNITVISDKVTIKSSVKDEQREAISALADKIAESIAAI